MYEIRNLIPLPQRSELVRKYAVNAKIFGGIWRHLDQHLTQHFSFITPYENEKTHENLLAVQTPCQTSYLLRPRQYRYICDSLWRDLKSNTREKWITFPCTYKLKPKASLHLQLLLRFLRRAFARNVEILLIFSGSCIPTNESMFIDGLWMSWVYVYRMYRTLIWTL
jgi:hypothetical protein